MATEIKLPELGEGAESADVVRVMVAPGQDIEANQSIIEVESDKATVEVPAPQGGRVESVEVKEGDTVAVGQVILTLADSDSGAEAGANAAPANDEGEPKSKDSPPDAGSQPSSDSKKSGGQVTFVLPSLGEGADQGDIVSVLVAVGDHVKSGQSVVEIESDKASVEVPSDVEGEVVEVSVSVGDTVSVGQALMVVKTSAEAGDGAPKPETTGPDEAASSEASASSARSTAASASATADGQRPVAAAPSVRTRAREMGIQIRDVPARDPSGRITKEDLDAFARGEAQPDASRPQTEAEAGSRPSGSITPADRREKMSGIRRTIAQRMTESWQTVPHVTLYREADATVLEGVRKRFKAKAEARGTKLTVTAILVRICASVLRRFPNANASVDLEAQEIVHHGAIHIGVAADTDRGLVVPVVRDAPSQSILDIAERLNELAEKARSGKLARPEMTGATFSLSNLGGLGIGYFTPIINPPEVAILGVGRAREDGSGRLMLPLSLSIDHRALDGADGARVLQAIVEAVEDPVSLLFEG